MTAQVIDLFPTGSDADDTIRQTVRALMKGRSLRVEDLAPRVGMSAATLYRRLGSKGSKEAFKAGEVASIARVLNVSVAQLYDGLGGTFTPQPPPAREGAAQASSAIPDTRRYRELATAA